MMFACDRLPRTGEIMAKYMYQASYTLDGVRGLLKDTASARRKAVEAAIGDSVVRWRDFTIASEKTTLC